jgi:50S ribosomal protein L16 3-hydroxylase
LLVQGVDQQVQAVRALMDQFRFVPDARLDDVMVSFATDGGGVGPHFDSYDVFLLQANGRRRWQISAQRDLTLRDGVPLKILQDFVPEQSFDLAPGDMLYLPPRYAHDGVAQGDCMTYSIGFRAPARAELARELLLRLADEAAETVGEGLYADPRQAATDAPAAIPPGLAAFAQTALHKATTQPELLAQLLGECLTEPKANVWFDAPASQRARAAPCGVQLDCRTKMLFDARHVFINGESVRATGADARLMQALANQRELDTAAVGKASEGARALLDDWQQAGWLHEC